ncbi:MAG: cytochrome c3 family protein [Planctomycetes bacterium]|nr:cytochrome c3 family protein [Planctomycetota bacterium]
MSARITVLQNGAAVFAGDHEVLVGARTGCDVVVEDPIVADRHCRIEWDGAQFTVRDLGSVTGTWIDGRTAAAAGALTDGAIVVLGSSQLVARIEGKGAAARLSLDVQRQVFAWTRPAKGVFDNDPDALVRAEVEFGRFPALRWANRGAAVVAAVLLLAALFVAAVFEPLASPGPLLPAHAFAHAAADLPIAAAHAAAAKIAGEQGCSACHDRGQGATMQKCMQCHGDLAAPATWRHPWLGDGVPASVPGQTVDEAFCTTCHRDHEGRDFLHPDATARLGRCEQCHEADRATMLARVQPPAVGPARQQPLASVAFAHDAHLAKGMPCTVCHALDADVRSDHALGAPDDPQRRDFAAVPFATCAACHVPGAAPLAGIGDADAARWRPTDDAHRWNVAWHGTDDGGKGCRQCHASSDGGIAARLRTTERPALSLDQQIATRGRYVAGRRLHEAEFAAHAAGRSCAECHLRGGVVPGAPRQARPFWHALHLAASHLQPTDGTAGAVSKDERGGCLSCHGDRRSATELRAAAAGVFAWPSDPAAQAACQTCHADGERTSTLQAVPVQLTAEQRRAAPDFPHGPHVQSPRFGQPGSALADGCFACHTFAAPDGADPLHAVPTLKPGAGDCKQCHQDHADVGGNACRHCHPQPAGTFGSFHEAAVRTDATPSRPTRAWPAANGFSHLSPGHSGDGLDGRPLTCTSCHDERATAAANTLAAVPVPDESLSLCRDCHLQRQFHWR